MISKNQKAMMLFLCFFTFLLLIRSIHNFHVKEKYTDNISNDSIITTNISSDMLDATIVEPEYIESIITDTIYRDPIVPVQEITCEPKMESFNKINVNEISTHTDNENDHVEFTNNVNINGTLDVKEKIKINDKVLFNYDKDSKTLII